MKDERLALLASRYVDGQLTAAEKAELEDLLLHSATARTRFWQETRLHGLLHELEGEVARVDVSPRIRRSAIRVPRQVWWAAGLAASLVLAIRFWPSGAAPREDEPTTAAVAVLAGAIGVQWDGAIHHQGDALSPGRLRFGAGLAQIEFLHGARMLVEGPADLDLLSSSLAYCRRGKLCVEVSEQARGFTVETPQGRVVDKGTSFGLEVTGDVTRVHVLKGEVDTGRRLLREGEGIALTGGGQHQPVAGMSATFVTPVEFDRRAAEETARKSEAWRVSASRLQADADLLLWMDFEMHDVGGRVGCEKVDGRWPGMQALGFRGIGDRVRVNVPTQHQSATLAAWVRVDGLHRVYNSLLMSQAFGPGALHWQINDKGRLISGVGGRNLDETFDFQTPLVFSPERMGRWTHLALVLDAGAKRVTHYVDGVPFSRRENASWFPIRIGEADVGNWSPGTFKNPYPVRHFIGRMDELAVFGRAFSDDEVRALYAAGSTGSRQEERGR